MRASRERRDVLIDLIGYRRYGHNEADEPAFTQPLMYSRIDERRSARKLYAEQLLNRGELSVEEAAAVRGPGQLHGDGSGSKEGIVAMPDRRHAANAKARAKKQLEKKKLSRAQYDRIVSKADRILKGSSG